MAARTRGAGPLAMAVLNRTSTEGSVTRQAADVRASACPQMRLVGCSTASNSLGRRGLNEESDRQRLVLALQAVASGDRPALQLVYRQTSAKLFGVCVRILGDRSEAEDVLQEVYLTVWRRAGAFDPARGVSPITWLATLARNRAIDRLRTSKAHLARPIEAAAQTPDPSPIAAESVLQVETAGRLGACLGELEAEHAGYIRAAYFDGQTYATLAKAAGAPLGTMKSWIRRGLLRLRACLDR